MKIGVFDSGLGGLIVLKALRKRLPQYDYIYLGDTKRVPYGDRTPETVYKYATECVDYLLRNDCELIIVACNTVSSQALRKLQLEYLPRHFPNRRILGVVVPTVETVADNKFSAVGIIGTNITVRSKAYIKELRKINKYTKVYQNAAPLLVPLIEQGQLAATPPLLKKYLQPLLKANVKSIILACTHYCLVKKQVKKIAGSNVTIVAQDDIIPGKLTKYLKRHPEIKKELSMTHTLKLLVTKSSPIYTTLAKQWFGKSAKLQKIAL